MGLFTQKLNILVPHILLKVKVSDVGKTEKSGLSLWHGSWYLTTVPRIVSELCGGNERRVPSADAVIPVPDVPEDAWNKPAQLTWDVEPHLPTHRDQPPQPFGLRHVIKASITVYSPHPPIYYTFLRFLRQDGGIDRICSVKQSSHGCSAIKLNKYLRQKRQMVHKNKKAENYTGTPIYWL